MSDYIIGYDPGRPIEPIKPPERLTELSIASLVERFRKDIATSFGIPPELLSPIRKPSYLDELRRDFKEHAELRLKLEQRAREHARRLGEVVREEIRRCQSGELS